jgi:GT2 family glycosyltransferase
MSGPLAVDASHRRQRHGPSYDRWIRAVDGLGDHATVFAPWLAGHMVAIRSSAHADIGGWDEGLRFTNEDLDAGLRLRKRNWRCVLVGHEVVHLGGHATPDADRFFVEGLRGGLVVSRRHAPRWIAWLHRVGLHAAATVVAGAVDASKRNRWQAVARMARSGVFDVAPFGEQLDDDADGFPTSWPPLARHHARKRESS